MIGLKEQVWAAAYGALFAQTADSIIHSHGSAGPGLFAGGTLTVEGHDYCDHVANRAAELAVEGYERRLHKRAQELRKGQSFGG